MKIGYIAFVALLSTCPSWCCDCFDISDGYCCSASIEEKKKSFYKRCQEIGRTNDVEQWENTIIAMKEELDAAQPSTSEDYFALALLKDSLLVIQEALSVLQTNSGSEELRQSMGWYGDDVDAVIKCALSNEATKE